MLKEYYYKIIREKISKMTAIHIMPNKRNGRKQEVHLMGSRVLQEINDRINNTNWRDGNGRKSKSDIVLSWMLDNQDKRKVDCIKDTGLTKPTVYKYWEEYKELIKNKKVEVNYISEEDMLKLMNKNL